MILAPLIIVGICVAAIIGGLNSFIEDCHHPEYRQNEIKVKKMMKEFDDEMNNAVDKRNKRS